METQKENLGTTRGWRRASLAKALEGAGKADGGGRGLYRSVEVHLSRLRVSIAPPSKRQSSASWH
jgi:hypothetical protein